MPVVVETESQRGVVEDEGDGEIDESDGDGGGDEVGEDVETVENEMVGCVVRDA